MIDILLVDDQKLFVNSLRTVLEASGREIRILGICYDGRDAVEFCRETRPDLVLLDVQMPRMDGVEASELLLREHPGLKILMLTTFNEDRYLRKALENGAVGYLLKDMLPEELLDAVETVMKGGISISPAVVKGSLMRKEPHSRPGWLDELTRKEWEILKYISLGYDNREIAEEAHLARQTVKNYVSAIYEKLNARDRMQVMRICIELRLFED